MSAIFIWSERFHLLTGKETGWRSFKSAQGIDGLMRIKGHDLELLAVTAGDPGKGQFRRFVAACKQKHDSICIWAIWNDDLPAILRRYGFRPHSIHEPDGELLEGYLWTAQ